MKRIKNSIINEYPVALFNLLPRLPRLKFLLLALCLFMMAACGGSDEPEEAPTPESSYQVPEDINDGLETADGKELGVDTDWLSNIKTAIEDEEFINMHSVLVAKENKLIYEVYFSGTDVTNQPYFAGITSKHSMQSITKSFTSALVGIALHQQGLDASTPLFEHFEEFDFSHDAKKSAITVADALSMSSGLEWDEWTYAYSDVRNDNLRMQQTNNWIDYVASKPMVDEPGNRFVYNSGLSVLLGEFVSNISNRNLGSFAQSNLFGPLRITNVDWYIGPNNVYQTGGGLSMSSRSLLKFGLLYANNGRWNGEQLIPEAWVQSSTRGQGANAANYAHQWWLTTYSVSGRILTAYLAAGYGGQYLIVIPEADLVVVFTAGNINELGASQARTIMERYILRAVL